MRTTAQRMSATLALTAVVTAALAADAVKEPGAIGQGYLIYAKWCAGCHAPDSPLAPGLMVGQYAGTYVLQQRYQGTMPAVLQERTNLTPPVIAFYVRKGLNTMPGFRKTEISDTQLDALTAYLTRNNPQ